MPNTGLTSSSCSAICAEGSLAPSLLAGGPATTKSTAARWILESSEGIIVGTLRVRHRRPWASSILKLPR